MLRPTPGDPWGVEQQPLDFNPGARVRAYAQPHIFQRDWL